MRTRDILFSQAGFSLVELIVAIGVFSILASGVTYLAIGGYDAFIGKSNTREIERLAEDVVEVMNVIKENSWSEVATTTSESVYIYKKTGGVWALGLGTQTIGSFTRDIRVASLYRDANNGGVVDTSDSTMWYSTNWPYRKQITINESKVSSTIDFANIPILVNTTDLQLRGTSSSGLVYQTDGGDILFTTANGTTKVDHEIEYYADSTGQLVAWVEVPTLDYNDDTILYMYFGNSAGGETNQWNINGTWDANYVGVWHLEEAVTNEQTSGSHADSTSNNNTGTQNNNDDTTGQIYNGQDVDGTGDYISVAYHSSLNATTSITMSAWVKNTSATSEYRGLLAKTNASAWDYELFRDDATYGCTAGHLAVYTDPTGTSHCSGAALTDTSWHYVSFSQDSANWQFFVDGQPKTRGSNGVVFPSNAYGFFMGSDRFVDFRGTMDEVRLSNIGRSGDWLATQYNSEYAPSAFMTIGNTTAIDPSTVKVTVTMSATGRANYVHTFYLSNWEAYRMRQNNWGGSSGDTTWDEGQDDYSSKSSTTPTSTEIILLQSDTE